MYCREWGFSPPQSLHLGSKTPQNTQLEQTHSGCVCQEFMESQNIPSGKRPTGILESNTGHPGSSCLGFHLAFAQEKSGSGQEEAEWDSRDPRSRR